MPVAVWTKHEQVGQGFSLWSSLYPTRHFLVVFTWGGGMGWEDGVRNQVCWLNEFYHIPGSAHKEEFSNLKMSTVLCLKNSDVDKVLYRTSALKEWPETSFPMTPSSQGCLIGKIKIWNNAPLPPKLYSFHYNMQTPTVTLVSAVTIASWLERRSYKLQVQISAPILPNDHFHYYWLLVENRGLMLRGKEVALCTEAWLKTVILQLRSPKNQDTLHLINIFKSKITETQWQRYK